jgi:hypothetical protein
MNSDFKDLLRLFNDRSVKYLVIGGYAVIKYTQPRYTGDLDIWIEASESNSLRVFDALSEFGAPLSTLNPADFAVPGFFFQMGIPPSRIDILMSVSGVEFPEAWSRKVCSKTGDDVFFFISKADLVLTKRAAGRPKDLADLESLSQSSNTDV